MWYTNRPERLLRVCGRGLERKPSAAAHPATTPIPV